MEINGLPLHALVVHAAVVLGPVAALGAILYALVSPWRAWLRWPVVVSATLAAVTIWVSYLSGEQVRDANTYGGALAGLLKTHEDRAAVLRIATSAFAVAVWVAAWLHPRTGLVRIIMSAVVVVAAVATLVWVVLTGDAGAKIGWFGIQG